VITVINKYKHDRTDAMSVMRPMALGNPFRINSAGGSYTREESVASYELWLREKLANRDPAVVNAMNSLWMLAQDGDLKLECVCAPLACHAHVIKKVLEEHL
jgi:hypothetical protein